MENQICGSDLHELQLIAQRDLDHLQRIQNKCARLVFMPPRRIIISPLLKKLHWLRMEDCISFKTLLYVYKSLNWLCPQYTDACLTVKRPCEGSVKTRTDHGFNLRVPRSNQCAGDKSLFSGCSPEHHPHSHPQCSFCCHIQISS